MLVTSGAVISALFTTLLFLLSLSELLEEAWQELLAGDG
jgi:hypothetical protein